MKVSVPWRRPSGWQPLFFVVILRASGKDALRISALNSCNPVNYMRLFEGKLKS
jgi:hypothetical protein